MSEIKSGGLDQYDKVYSLNKIGSERVKWIAAFRKCFHCKTYATILGRLSLTVTQFTCWLIPSYQIGIWVNGSDPATQYLSWALVTMSFLMIFPRAILSVVFMSYAVDLAMNLALVVHVSLHVLYMSVYLSHATLNTPTTACVQVTARKTAVLCGAV